MSETTPPNPESFSTEKTPNQITIEAYNNRVQEYIEGTPHEVSGEMKKWLDTSIENLPENAQIFEIGSGFGRDANYLEEQGFTVQRTDATPAFVELLNSQGFDAKHFNAIEDEMPPNQDLIVANAVLLHFTQEQTAGVIEKTYDALNENGKFAFSLKQGEGDSWIEEKLGTPRYFAYWKYDEMQQVLQEVGFKDVNINGDSEGHGASKDSPWLMVVATK